MESSGAFQPRPGRGRISHLPPPGDCQPARPPRVLGPGFSAPREPWGRRQLLFPPGSPQAPLLRRGHRSSGRDAGAAAQDGERGGFGSSLPAWRGRPADRRPGTWGREGAAPGGSVWVRGGKGAGFKVSRNPSAAGGGWRGCAQAFWGWHLGSPAAAAGDSYSGL